MNKYPPQVRIVEVGPRDGLQNESQAVASETKIEFIDRLSECGLQAIESTSFVSPKWIPQLADAEQVLAGISRKPGVVYPALVPNLQGLQRALECNVSEIAVFTAASETFNRKNINVGIYESLQRIKAVSELALERGLKVRGYISCVLGCPYEGQVETSVVRHIARQLLELGCYEVSLGDTIGVGTPIAAREMLADVAADTPLAQLAVHFHDTRGQALANILACLEDGVSVIDASVSGLGGCPYAGGATGNVATEDLVYMLHGMGIETGIDLDRLLDAGAFISAALNRQPASKLGRIASSKKEIRSEPSTI